MFKDPFFAAAFLRTLSYAASGGTDVGECMATAAQIRDGDLDSWFTAWYEAGQELRRVASRCYARDHLTSARDTYLRAAVYYRTATAFLVPGTRDPESLRPGRLSQACFTLAGSLTTPKFEQVAIPYAGTTLPGYFFPTASCPRATLILQPDLTGTAEDLYWEIGAAAVRQGYQCLAFEGPGQGQVLGEQRLALRPDWEIVVGAVVDYLNLRPDVDPQRLVLVGSGFGGHLAARAAAFESRLAACVVNGVIFSATEAAQREGFPPYPVRQDPVGLGQRWRRYASAAAHRQQQIRLRQFGVATSQELRRKYQAYTLDGIVYQIRCPLLICDHDPRVLQGTAAQQLYQAVTGPKTYIAPLPRAVAAGYSGAALRRIGQQIGDWLDELLAAAPGGAVSPASARAAQFGAPDRS